MRESESSLWDITENSSEVWQSLSELEARRKALCEALLEIETNMLEELVRSYEDMRIADFVANIRTAKDIVDLRRSVCNGISWKPE